MARTTVIPKWLKSTHVTGLDQLGIQVVSIALYGDLLPGLTNVTDRVRYHSFYPWVFHRYASDVRKLDERTWQDHLRRAEFLLALVGRFHHRQDHEGGEAIVGADQGTKALAEIQAKPSKVWRLSEWAAVDKAGQPGSYFKNKAHPAEACAAVRCCRIGVCAFQESGIRESLSPSPSHRPSPRVSRGRCDGEGGRDAPFCRARAEV